MIERELKIAVPDLAVVRSALEGAGARLESSETFEQNWVFDRNGELDSQGELLRLRRDGAGYRLTYKGRAQYDGGVKSRPEHEVSVDQGDVLHEILSALGMTITTRYEKYRESWLVDDCQVVLDRTPIGDFVEIEAKSEEAEPLRVAEKLELDASKAETLSYLKLYELYRQGNPKAPQHMVFGEAQQQT